MLLCYSVALFNALFNSRTQARELGLASMLLCVVMVFLLCNFPAMVVNILEVMLIRDSMKIPQRIGTLPWQNIIKNIHILACNYVALNVNI